MATMADSKARRTRRSFTDAYKTGAVRLVLDEGKTVAAAARDLGLTESSLRNWVEQARADRTKGKTGRKLPRQVDTAKGDCTGGFSLGKNVRGGTRPRLSCGRSWL